MRVVFLKDVQGVANGGDVKEVKSGFARNYLIPQSLATLATRDAMQRVARLGRQADDQRLKTLTDMKALAEQIDGVRVNVEMRAGASGRLYGSVTNAIVADEISSLTDREIDRRTISIPEAIRETGKHELRVRLHAEVDATINLLVHPTGTDPDEFLELLEGQEKDGEGPEGEPEPDAAAPEAAAPAGPATEDQDTRDEQAPAGAGEEDGGEAVETQ